MITLTQILTNSAARPQHFAQRPACNAVHSPAGRCGQAGGLILSKKMNNQQGKAQLTT